MFRLTEDRYYNLDEADDIIINAKKNGYTTTNTKINYYNIVCAFDIETTSFIDPHAPIEDNKRSLMYVWQCAIDGRVIIGRTWEEFVLLTDKLVDILGLNKNNRILCYIHNAQYEFQFCRHYFKWLKVFAIDTRRPIYGITEDGIEFRCSYILTNYSLEKLGEQLQKYHVKKCVGSLDYTQIRTPYTRLTKTEIQYCINDVLVVSAYIQEQIEKEGNITKIPLTATGYCRRYVRHECLYSGGRQGRKAQNSRYRAKMLAMKILDVEEYKQLKRAFQGGFTHASAYYSSWTLHEIDSLDFCSSYPFALLSEKYPCSTGKQVKINSKEEFDKYMKCYCCIFEAEFIGLEPTFKYENYISVSKCRDQNDKPFTYETKEQTRMVVNNGRLVSCDRFKITLTNVDWEIITRTYKFKECNINHFRIYKKDYLPVEIIKSIIYFYKAKTTLKGVKGKETEYLNGKALLNSVYGMMVTDIIKDTYVYEDDWNIEHADPEKDLERYNNSRKRFLFYPWGVFCTAYARRNLWAGILEFGEDYVYADTDSIKCRNILDHQEYVESYNELTQTKLKKMCAHYHINYEEELLPKTIKGEVKPLGVFDWETKDAPYDYFKTLGAKRYMVFQDGQLSITVSGINKKVAVPYLLKQYSIDECFEAFNFGLEIPACATGKLTHYYLDSPHEGTITDIDGIEYNYRTLSGIYLEPAEYSFDLATEYINYLKGYFYVRA